MNAQDAMARLSGMLMKEEQGRYRLRCRKTILFVRLQGSHTSIRFAGRDGVVFEIDAAHLTVVDLKTRVIRSMIPWSRIESVAAGEPESENHDLFQG
jgi:hypothetical protein